MQQVKMFIKEINMTREDEICSASSDHRDWVCCGFIDFVADARRDSFAEGAKWADKTMIDKACEWLKRNAEDYVVTCYDKGELDSEGLLMAFRKAMEE
jgi:hypothetical protein